MFKGKLKKLKEEKGLRQNIKKMENGCKYQCFLLILKKTGIDL